MKQIAEVKLVSETGMLINLVVTLDETASLLSGNINIPVDTAEIAIWFTLTGPSGDIYYDSDNGNNFHFRLETVDYNFNAR